jgi:hypothetical protein
LHRCSLNDRESFHHYTWLHAPLIPPFKLSEIFHKRLLGSTPDFSLTLHLSLLKEK